MSGQHSELFLDRCLSSIFQQKVDNDLFEVIVVNDGSSDNSNVIVGEYAKKHLNLKVIDQTNQGVSVARNKGVCESTGAFLMFVDSDDYLLDCSIQSIISCITNWNKSDLIILQRYTDQNNVLEEFPSPSFKKDRYYTGTEAFMHGYTKSGPCGICYRRNYLDDNNIHFIKGLKNGEDTIFVGQCQMHASKIYFSMIPCYVIVYREGSASSLRPEILNNWIESAYAAHNLCLSDGLNVLQQSLMSFVVYEIVSNMVNDAIRLNVSYNELINRFKYKELLPTKQRIYPLLGAKIRLMNFSFRLFYYLTKYKYNILSFLRK